MGQEILRAGHQVEGRVQPGRRSVRGRSVWSWLETITVLSLMVFAGGTSIWGQEILDLTGAANKKAAPKPQFTTTLTASGGKSAAELAPGDEVVLSINVTLPKGHYIGATSGNFGGKTQITTQETGLEAVDLEWVPDRKPEVAFEPELKEEVSKFYDAVTWKKTYRVAKGAEAGKVSVSGELNGQYCTSGGEDGETGACFPIIPPYTFEAKLSAPVYDYAVRPGRGKSRPAVARFQLHPQNAKPGEKVTLSITLKMDEGWHTFATTHTGEGGLATEFELTETPGLKALGKGFVPDVAPITKTEELDKSTKLTLTIHEGLITWSRQLEVLPGIEPGKYGVNGSISYQVCKESCLPPSPVEFSFPYSGTLDPDLNPPVANDYVRPEEAHSARPQDKGLIPYLLLAIGWGFVSLLTPCVFPMVPITVSFFLKQAERQHSSPILLAIVYCLTIIATFSLIGVGVTALFGAGNTLNAIATGAWANLFIGLMFGAFAFNMLGMFEIRIPSWMLNWTAQGESAGGYVGAIFMALTFTLTSFTCTFAFAGTVLVGAANGEFFWPLIGMAAFGAAFASPFFVLALVPGMLKKLPKSGGWMHTVKTVMGLVELAFAFKFLSIVDQQWNSVPILLDFTNVMTLWSVLSLIIGLYLLDLFRFSHDSPTEGLSVPRVMLATAFLVLSGLTAVGLMQPERESWLIDQIVSFAPAQLTDHLGFGNDFDVAVSDATAQEKPLFVDFTGVFCVNCRLMEKRMIRPVNLKRLNERHVGVQLYTDRVPRVSDAAEAKRILKRNVELQTEWFGDVTLPSYAIVTPDGKTVLARFVGLEQKEGDFGKFLDEGWLKWQSMQAP